MVLLKLLSDPEKVKAIKEMPLPTSKVELQRFLGMINYLGKFLPNLAEETSPLRLLLKKDNEFMMDEPQVDSVDRLKRLVTTAPVLGYFNSHLPTRIRTDSSSEGLGAMIEQSIDGNWFPVAYASRSLTSAEKNYAQIEKETLSIVFGCERFREYVYGRKFTVCNDHLPLKSIFSKTLTSCPPRIQRFLLRLQHYDFQFEYIPGSKLVVADTLSRAALSNKQGFDNDNEIVHHVSSVISNIPISQRKLSLTKEFCFDNDR